MTKSQKYAAFIVTKPIQLLVVLAILEQELFHEEVTIIFCENFNDSKRVERRFKKACRGSIHSYLCKSRLHAINFAASKGYDCLYLDSDVGVQHYIALLGFKLRSPSCSVNVFEEGLGTYNEDSYTGVKEVILKALGVGGNFGGNVFVSRIFLYDPDEYIAKFYQQRKKVILIKTSIWNSIDINRKRLKKTFNIITPSDSANRMKVCYIYMTAHHVDYDFLTQFKKNDGQLFIKYHPHLYNSLEVEGVQVLNSSAPIEYIIYEFLSKYDNVVLYDHHSAARRYVLDPRVSFKSIHEL
jgi:hypothetical protein